MDQGHVLHGLTPTLHRASRHLHASVVETLEALQARGRGGAKRNHGSIIRPFHQAVSWVLRVEAAGHSPVCCLSLAAYHSTRKYHDHFDKKKDKRCFYFGSDVILFAALGLREQARSLQKVPVFTTPL